MSEPTRQQTIALGLLGAAVGGCVGYFAFFWIVRQGYYAIILPGALLGLGAGLLARRRSMPLAVICGILGLGLGLFTEWRFEPFIADSGLSYFIAHIPNLRPVTLLMLALGAFFSFRLALGLNTKAGGA